LITGLLIGFYGFYHTSDILLTGFFTSCIGLILYEIFKIYFQKTNVISFTLGNFNFGELNVGQIRKLGNDSQEIHTFINEFMSTYDTTFSLRKYLSEDHDESKYDQNLNEELKKSLKLFDYLSNLPTKMANQFRSIICDKLFNDPSFVTYSENILTHIKQSIRKDLSQNIFINTFKGFHIRGNMMISIDHINFPRHIEQISDKWSSNEEFQVNNIDQLFLIIDTFVDKTMDNFKVELMKNVIPQIFIFSKNPNSSFYSTQPNIITQYNLLKSKMAVCKDDKQFEKFNQMFETLNEILEPIIGMNQPYSDLSLAPALSCATTQPPRYSSLATFGATPSFALPSALVKPKIELTDYDFENLEKQIRHAQILRKYEEIINVFFSKDLKSMSMQEFTNEIIRTGENVGRAITESYVELYHRDVC
jgi:hypothetical protein